MRNFRVISLLGKIPRPQIGSRHFSSCDQDSGRYVIGKSAIVTGASMGIGLECVKALLKNGVMNIVMSSATNIKLGEEELNKLRRKYIRSCLCYVKCDVTCFEDMNALFKTATSMFDTVDVVVNNAGIFNDSNWSRMIDINLKGMIYGTKLGMNCMNKTSGGNGGAIVNIASILGLAPMAGAPAYTATKHAVVGFTRAMAMPFHYCTSGVRVMAMCPGVTDTPLIKNAQNLPNSTALEKEAAGELAALPAQPVCYCGLCLIEMLREGDTGSIWVTEDKEIYEIDIPERSCMRRR